MNCYVRVCYFDVVETLLRNSSPLVRFTNKRNFVVTQLPKGRIVEDLKFVNASLTFENLQLKYHFFGPLF